MSALAVGDYVGETEQGTVQLDGYVDTTQRENLILSGNLVGEFDRHTLIVGAEYIDTSSNQDRYNMIGRLMIIVTMIQLGLHYHFHLVSIQMTSRLS